jgi:DNA-binding transcriptional regulator YhcF (GntR family)|tara:strand:+ start:90 stop:536 length:447 start_codon:yes stop_codon:yes gene_type:complete
MNNTVLKTSADDLYGLVKSRKKISVEEAAKILKISGNVVQSLVDFLVEEGTFGIEYKFTTPYIYISEEKEKNMEIEGKPKKRVMEKQEFFQKAGKWNISSEKISDLWKKYIQENIGTFKEEFYIKANARNIPKERIDLLWGKYQETMQ